MIITDELVEKAAEAVANGEGVSLFTTCGFEADEDDCENDQCPANSWEDHDPKLARDYYRRIARNALSAVADAA